MVIKPIIDKAMESLQARNISLYEYNEIIYISLGITSYTSCIGVNNFYKALGYNTYPIMEGWFIEIPQYTAHHRGEDYDA